MRKALLVVSLTVLMAVSVPSGAATQTVTALGGNFVPPAAVAASSDTIRLQNGDVLPHTLTLNDTSPLGGKFCRDAFGVAITCNTGFVASGGTGSFTLVSAPAGTYRFFCQIHANMNGLLVVR